MSTPKLGQVLERADKELEFYKKKLDHIESLYDQNQPSAENKLIYQTIKEKLRHQTVDLDGQMDNMLNHFMNNNQNTIQRNPYLPKTSNEKVKLPKIQQRSLQINSNMIKNQKKDHTNNTFAYKKKQQEYHQKRQKVFEKIYKRKIESQKYIDIQINNRPAQFFFLIRIHRYEEQFQKKQILTQDQEKLAFNMQISESPKIKKKTLKVVPSQSLNHFTSKKQNLLDISYDSKQKDYKQIIDQYSLHQFIIRKGQSLRDTEEFISYKRTYFEIWDRIENKLRQLEQFFSKNNVRMANVDGKKLLELINKSKLTKEDCVYCLVNMEDVASQLNILSLKYKGENRHSLAAIYIQKYIRRFLALKNYKRIKILLQYKIQRFFKMKIIQKNIRSLILQRNSDIFNSFQERQKIFKLNWSTIKYQHRTEIHFNSLNFTEYTRLSTEHFLQKQNNDILRIFRLRDPLLSIIYISPYPLSQEIIQYYQKTLSFENIHDAQNRLIFMYPSDYDCHTSHLSLNTLLLYSSKTIKRIKRLIKNKESYIVGGVPSQDDIRICEALKIPYYGTINESQKLIGSAGVQFIGNIGLPIPLGISGLTDHQELITSLSQLIIKNFDIVTWIFKIDGEFEGNGIAAFSIHKKKKYKKLQKTLNLSSENSRDMQLLLERYLYSQLKPVNKNQYPNTKFYLNQFFQKGGSISALPLKPCQTFSISFEIQPDGTFQVLNTYTKLQNYPYKTIMHLSPQQSLQTLDADQIVNHICPHIYENQIFGFFTLNAISFDGTFQVVSLQNRLKMSLPDVLTILPTKVQGLDKVDFQTFFHMCRVNYVVLDVDTKEGVWWQLVDGLQGGVLGMIVQGENKIKDAIKVWEWLFDLKMREFAGILAKLRVFDGGRIGKQIEKNILDNN